MKSLLFLRKDTTEHQIRKLDAPWSIVDLEDAIEPAEKASARSHLRGLLDTGVFASRGLLVRINGRDSGEDNLSELRELLHPDIDLIILPMIQSADDVAYFDALVREAEAHAGLEPMSIRFLCLLERPAAILAAGAIAKASPRVSALGFGHHDFFAELGTEPSKDMLATAQATIVLAARAAGIDAIASPFLQLKNYRGFERACRAAKDLGFSGIFTLQPHQDRRAQSTFSPSAREIHRAKALLAHQREQGSIGVHQGSMIGPPDLVWAKKILGAAEVELDSAMPAGEMLVGRAPRYGLDLSTARVGQVMECPVEVTIDPGWRALWQASFPSSSRIHTSRAHAQKWGLDDTALPFGMLLNLTLCLAVEPFSESCTLHLGIEDAQQRVPAYINDSLQGKVRIESMRNTSSGEASVIVTTHILVNQHRECVFRLTKYSYYPPLSESTLASAPLCATEDDALFDGTCSDSLTQCLLNCESPPTAPRAPLAEGELILHPPVRPIGHSENLLLTTLFRNTHPVHFDTLQFGDDGLIVCGGFVQALAHACSERELRPIVEEQLEYSQHVNPVRPGERIGAISRVLESRPISEHLEEVRVMTLGLREVEVLKELGEVPLPASLFDPREMKPSDVQAICRAHCPPLEDRIALRSLRIIRRPRAVSAQKAVVVPLAFGVRENERRAS